MNNYYLYMYCDNTGVTKDFVVAAENMQVAQEMSSSLMQLLDSKNKDGDYYTQSITKIGEYQ